MLVSVIHAALKVVGSLFLTVAILAILIVILLWGMSVESNFGATAAKFGIYGSWWFNALGCLLGLNSAVALILRWPWRLRQMGFIIPHIGLIVLLVGCFLSRQFGVEAALSVFEGESSDLAYKGTSQHVELGGQQHFNLRIVATDGTTSDKPGKPIVLRFTPGPFNWEDYRNGKLSFWPWSLARRDQGVLYENEGVRLEVVDYLSDSTLVGVPSLRVQIVTEPDGQSAGERVGGIRLSVKKEAGSSFLTGRFGAGSENTLASGLRALFWMTGSEGETEAFLHSKPDGPLGRLGRVVLYTGGKKYDWSLDDWKPGTRRRLGDTGSEVELANVTAVPVDVRGDVVRDRRVFLTIHHNSDARPLVLSAAYPHVNSRQDYEDKVFGAFWPGDGDRPKDEPKSKSEERPVTAAQKGSDAKASATSKFEPNKPEGQPQSKQVEAKAEKKGDSRSASESAQASSPPRVDFLQGADQRLYLRTWRAGEVMIKGPLAVNEGGGQITVFRGTPDAVVLWFGDFQPADSPGFSPRPMPFDKSEDHAHLRQARLRLTVDDRSEEFWMPCISPDPLEEKDLAVPDELQRRTVAGKGRMVQLGWIEDEVQGSVNRKTVADKGQRIQPGFAPESFHIGYSVFLHKAWRKLDPGTRKPSFYGSEIDLVPNEFAAKASASSSGKVPPKYENRLVTLNAPLDFADPAHPGHSYRMFQSTMPGPFNPEQFDRKPGESVYLSGFTLNYDPGRGLTYVGCLLVVAGIFIAYFVKFVIPRRGGAGEKELPVGKTVGLSAADGDDAIEDAIVLENL
jgi:hypothetical protein